MNECPDEDDPVAWRRRIAIVFREAPPIPDTDTDPDTEETTK